MTCPNCQGEMRSSERGRVTVDQCGRCGGIFLDRGELERLSEAEGRYYEGRYGTARERHRGHEDDDDRGRYRRDRDDDDDDDRGRYGERSRYGGRSRSESFLGELFG